MEKETKEANGANGANGAEKTIDAGRPGVMDATGSIEAGALPGRNDGFLSVEEMESASGTSVLGGEEIPEDPGHLEDDTEENADIGGFFGENGLFSRAFGADSVGTGEDCDADDRAEEADARTLALLAGKERYGLAVEKLFSLIDEGDIRAIKLYFDLLERKREHTSEDEPEVQQMAAIRKAVFGK